MNISEFLSHPLLLEIISPIIAMIIGLMAHRINKGRLKPLFEKHSNMLKECKDLHIEVMEEIGADSVIIIRAGNKGKLPTLKNNWKISIKKEYKANGESIVKDWQDIVMDEPYYEMLAKLLYEKVITFKTVDEIGSKYLKQAHEKYDIHQSILVKYFYRRRFLIFGQNEIWFARFGYGPDGDPQKIKNAELVFLTKREKLAKYWL